MSHPRRRTKRPPKRGRTPGFRIEQVAFGPEPGENVASPSLGDLERALRAHDDDFAWASVSSDVIPVMPRVRPYAVGFPEPLRVMVEPGIAIGFAIDIGPAFMNVGSDLLRSWDVPLREVHTQSLMNLSGRAARIDPGAIVEGSLDDTPTRWLQSGQSISSVLILVPDTLRQIFGPEPAFFITPMRDLIIGLPLEVDRELAAWLWLEIAAEDPNCLGPMGYRFDGSSVWTEPLNLPFEPASSRSGTGTHVI